MTYGDLNSSPTNWSNATSSRVLFFVATAKNQVIGCCALQIYSKRIAEVRTLAVHPNYQDKGVASKLVELCRDRAATAASKNLRHHQPNRLLRQPGLRDIPPRKDRHVLRTSTPLHRDRPKISVYPRPSAAYPLLPNRDRQGAARTLPHPNRNIIRRPMPPTPIPRRYSP